MDDAERLRALAFASIPKKSYCWVRADREEGELSSDGEVEIDKVKKVKSRRRPHKKRRGGFQSAAPPTGVPHRNLKVRSGFPLTLQEQQLHSNVHSAPAKENIWQKPEDMPQIIAKAPLNTAQLQRASNPGGAELQKPTINNVSDNQFLIKFSDDDSESDGEPGETLQATQPAPKPAILSLEINRMKKQIAAMERVKAGTRSNKTMKAPANKQVISAPKPSSIKEVEISKKQAGVQRRDDPPPEKEGAKRKRDENNKDSEASKRVKPVAPLPASADRGLDKTLAIVSTQPVSEPEVVIGASSRTPAPAEVKVSQPELTKSSLELLEIEEETLDKELEAAQSLRHTCEIRERLARKAYREAQEALRRANAECERLHQKREVLGLKVRATEMRLYSKASGEDILQSLLLAEASSLKPSDAGVLETGNEIVLVEPERQKGGEPVENGAGNEIFSQDPASASTHEVENEGNIVIENGSPRSGDARMQQADEKLKDSTEKVSQEELQSSSSTAGDLKRKGGGGFPEPVAGDPPKSSTPPEALPKLNSGDLLKPPPGSSAASSVDEVKNEKKKLPVITKTSVRRSTMPSAGRLVIFRQVSFTVETGTTADAPDGHFEITLETSAPRGVYESPLKPARALDPFKPVCKYEHRGICNNEVCDFQHMKRGGGSENGVARSHWSVDVQVPTYRIGRYLMKDSSPEMQLMRLGSLKPDEGSYTFLSSISVQRPLPQDMPCIFEALKGEREGSEELESENVSKQNYAELLSRDSSVDSCLELALSILQFDINLKNTNCLKNALYVLSRALEANQSSVALWVVYLLLFSVRDTLSKKDDMFLHAIRQNRYSYELWILVLSSRSSLAAILESYELAILTLCEDANKSSERSSCILDLVLRMLYTMIISESKPSAWIDELAAPGAPGARRWRSSSIILKNLSPSDASILWISCAFISAHGKMPGSVISRLGCKQLPLSTLDWETPGVVLHEESRSRALKIMETGTQWLASSGEPLAEQILAVNYMKFLLATWEFSRASTLGLQALHRHPFSLELIVLLANAQKLAGGSKSGLGVFQNALSNWPSERPGAQILWGQYAGHALSWEGEESALMILRRCSNGGLSNQVSEDSGFFLVNLAMFEALSGNISQAREALEMAINSSEADINSWLEYSSFRLSGIQEFQRFRRVFLEIMDRCHIQSRLSSNLAPLGRGFLRSIRKRRIRGFVDNLLGAAPSDHFFLNSLLQSSLLDDHGGDLKSLAEFVGGILEIFPGNFALAMAFCRVVVHRMKSGGVPASTPAWAASLLMASLRVSLPLAPEDSWLEAGELLQLLGLGDSCGSFYRQALGIYPFSASIWRRYVSECKKSGNEQEALSAAREAGMAGF